MSAKHITALFVFLMLAATCGTASAWLSGYDHRMAITVNNGEASPLTYYQFNFTNDTNTLVAAGHMQASGADCRITDHLDNLIPFWNETAFNASGTKIWANATTLEVGSNMFYMYYGNAAASSVVDGDATFEFFDDCEATEHTPMLENFEKYAGNPVLTPKGCHPDVLYFPDGKDGYNYWMAYTPYPSEPDELPTIVRSNDGFSWTDVGISNPVILGNTSETWRSKTMCDLDMIYVEEIDMWFMVYVGVQADVPFNCSVAFAYSNNGTNWTEYDGVAVNSNTLPVILNAYDDGGVPEEIMSTGGAHTTYPSLLYEDGIIYLFYSSQYANATFGTNFVGGRYATFTWNNSTNDIENFQRSPNNPIWHTQANLQIHPDHQGISYYNGTYYLHGQGRIYPPGSGVDDCFSQRLWTATDKNGSWTYHSEILRGDGGGEYGTYRSVFMTYGNGTIALVDDKLRYYYGGTTTADGGTFSVRLANGTESVTSDYAGDKWAGHFYVPTFNYTTSESYSGSQALRVSGERSGNAGGGCGIVARDLNITNAVVEAMVKTSGSANMLTARAQSLKDHYGETFYGARPNNAGESQIYNSTVSSYTKLGTGSANSQTVWAKWSMKYYGDSIKYFYNDAELVSVTDSNITTGSIGFRLDIQSDILYADDIRVRKYTTTEPTSALGVEEYAITATANQYTQFNDWETDHTFAQIAALNANDIVYSWYNHTSGLHEAYYVGRTYNQNAIIPMNCSVLGFFDTETIIEIATRTSITIPNAAWFYGFLPGSSSMTLTNINASMTTDGLACQAVYRWDGSAWNASGTVQPKEGIITYNTNAGEWTP